MKLEDLKVGMKVRAVDDYYCLTTKSHKWVGTVTKVCGNGTFNARTESSVSIDKNREYVVLRPEHFEAVVTQKKDVSTLKTIPLKVTYDRDNIYVIYKGKVVAKATCREDDNFNEEFGLNLALRRFCKTLCDENTTKKVIYNTDKVEDFI